MKENVSKVVKDGLCTSCGICAGACHKDSISFHYGKERNTPRVDVQKCVNCGLCYNVCPGKGIELVNWGKRLFGEVPEIKTDLCVGHYLRTYVGHSTKEEIRMHAATGGMVSQFLMWLLKKGEIEGAVVVRYRKDNPLEPEPFIATTEEEIWESRSSKYVVLSMDKVAQQIASEGYRNLVVVGLPCHIQGWRQLASKNKNVRDAIKGYFAIYCSVNKTKHSLDYYPYRYNVNPDKIGRFTFRDDGCMGFMKFEDKDGKVMKKVPYLSFWFGTHSFFANPRCSLCIDQLGELADVSFGDIHIPPYSDDHIGTNSMITRSDYWDKLLHQCCKEGFVTLEEIAIEKLTKSQSFTRSFKKGAGVKTNMQLRKMVGKKNPEYDYRYYGGVSIKNLISEIGKGVMRMIGSHRSLWWVIKMLDRNKDS